MSWRDKWRIPRTDLGAVVFFFAVSTLFFIWIGLSIFGVEGKAIEAAHDIFPPWFFIANLFLAPVLMGIGAAPLRVPIVLRFVVVVLMLCSVSLFIVTRQHQALGLAMLGFIYFEAYWIIPRWIRWVDGRSVQTGVHGSDERVGFGSDGSVVRNGTGTVPKPSGRTRLLNLALYVIIAVGRVAMALIRILR